jgi:predicted nucleotidyltransferase
VNQPLVYHGIAFDPEAIRAFCIRHGVRRLSLFGSILRGDFSKASDVDILLEYAPEHVPTLLDKVSMEQELSEIVGRKVDLRTPGDLSRLFRQKVIDSAQRLYAA